MRATYTNIEKFKGKVNGVQYATATAHIGTASSMKVSDRLSKFVLFQKLTDLQNKYGIPESDIDELLILMNEDAQQA